MISTVALLAVLLFVADVWADGAIRGRLSSWAASFGPSPAAAGATPTHEDVAAVFRAAETITREGR